MKLIYNKSYYNVCLIGGKLLLTRRRRLPKYILLILQEQRMIETRYGRLQNCVKARRRVSKYSFKLVVLIILPLDANFRTVGGIPGAQQHGKDVI